MNWLLKFLGVPKGQPKALKAAVKVGRTLSKATSSAKAVEAPQKPKTVRKTIDLEDLPYDEYEIVGEAHYQEALEGLAGPKTETGVNHECEVLLVCERANKFDKNAVRVEVSGKAVGYLSRDDAESFREMLADEEVSGAKVKASARITGGWRREDGEGNYGIALVFD